MSGRLCHGTRDVLLLNPFDPGDQTTANVTANEIGYSADNDETTSSSSTGKGVPVLLTETTTFSGLNGESISVARSSTWTDQWTAVDPDTDFPSLDTNNNRYWQFYGTSMITYNDSSNVSGRAILSGS